MSLKEYNKKRNFEQTPEPSGKAVDTKSSRFVIQRHDASHLHYDFRLEIAGTLKSWAVPKGVSMNPKDKRLAVMVEDHPVSYINFEGTIPKGNYGAGKVKIWDKGYFFSINAKQQKLTDKQAIASIKKGKLDFIIKGKKIAGRFALVRLKDDEKNWLIIKQKDEYAEEGSEEEEEERLPVKISSIRAGPDKKEKKFITPMLASPVANPFSDEEWIYEIKYDGYRAIAELENEQVRLYSRNGISFAERFAKIKTALTKLSHIAILDGEIAVLNKKGMPDFQLLQHYAQNKDADLVYFVFDLLSLDGNDLKDMPLTDRKNLLKLFLKSNKIIRYSNHISTDGEQYFKEKIAAGYEGIMAKRKDSVYLPGFRTKNWLKIKAVTTQEVIIIGFTKPKGARKHFGSILLAQYDEKKKLKYVGHAGTGFSDTTLKELWDKFLQLKINESPFDTKINANGPVTWIKPKLIAEIGYSEITKDGLFRHPVFKRLRDDKTMKEVITEPEKEIAMPQQKDKKNTGEKVNFSNLEKIYWPGEGITKGDLIKYYEQIADYILPYLKNRPMSLKRNPDGIRDEGFYQKDAAEIAPAWMKTIPVESTSSDKTTQYALCNDLASLLFLANLGCIEMNPWNSTISKMDYPDYIVMDIDPSEKNTFNDVIDVCLVLKEILEEMKISGYCKTSGASGMHIYIPCNKKYSYDEVRDFSKLLATFTNRRLPEKTTLESSLSKRSNKHVYVDYLQNRRGQTLASCYSVRPKSGATVSTPLEWKEIKYDLEPSDFTIKNIFKRLEKKGRPLYTCFREGNRYKKSIGCE